MSTDRYVVSDLFDLQGVLVIPTNEGKVHGAGLAKAAKTRGIINDPTRVFQLDVKRHWREKTDIHLLVDNLRGLIRRARADSDTSYWLPLVGLGHGEGDPNTVLPYLIEAVDFTPNIVLVLPTAAALTTVSHGTARTDRTADNLGSWRSFIDHYGT